MPVRGEMTLPNQVFEAGYPHIEPSMLSVSANNGIGKGRQFLFDGNPTERNRGGLCVLCQRHIHVACVVHAFPDEFGAVFYVHVNTRHRSLGCRCRRTARHLAPVHIQNPDRASSARILRYSASVAIRRSTPSDACRKTRSGHRRGCAFSSRRIQAAPLKVPLTTRFRRQATSKFVVGL